MTADAGDRYTNWPEEVQAVGTRLNQLPADPDVGSGSFGGKPDLASSPDEKRAAARAIENHIKGDTYTAGTWADTDTGAVVREFGAKDGHGWLISRAVSKAHKTWREQVKGLMHRLSNDVDSLGGANRSLHGTDTAIGTKAGKVSVFRSY